MSTDQTNQQIRDEFNRWAASGRGDDMQNDHWPITLPMLARMDVQPDENIFDVGCGSGWLSRTLAGRAVNGRVVGMDISDEMIRRARAGSADFSNLVFIVGGVDEIPWENNFFTRAVSVESSYYWPDPARGLREIFRVLHPAGSLWILINFYRDNPHSHQWAEKLAVPVNLYSAAEWEQMFRDAGFTNVAHDNIPDPTPNPDVYTGRWFRDAAQLAEFRRIGALLLTGVKP